jgi:hypothetical protein
LPIFRLLLEHGAHLPESFLRDVITWGLGDWRIDSRKDEEDLIGILKLIRSTKAWLPASERRELAARLDGYSFAKLVATLLNDVSSDSK